MHKYNDDSLARITYHRPRNFRFRSVLKGLFILAQTRNTLKLHEIQRTFFGTEKSPSPIYAGQRLAGIEILGVV